MLSRHGDISEMLDILRTYCTQFPRGLLRLEADHPYGAIITLWCHCTMSTGCEVKCASDADRPKAVLVLSESELGNKSGPHLQAELSAHARQEMTLSPPAQDTK